MTLYKCGHCGAEFSEFRSMKRDFKGSISCCPGCGKTSKETHIKFWNEKNQSWEDFR